MRLPSHPLPKRNRREALLRRTAALIPDQQHLDVVLRTQKPDTQKAWLETLRPYLRFEAKPLVEL